MEFSNIQPVSQSGQLEPISVSTAADLISIFHSRANAGDQIELFLAIAEGQPKTAITAFSTVVRNITSSPIKALALQGFGRIAQPYKQALALCKSRTSQELLRLLCDQITFGRWNNDLTTWAAAEALREIGFFPGNIQHPQGGNLSEPPRRIQNEIIDRKIQEINWIQRLNIRGQFTAEYERLLEFWVYGPTSELFNENLTAAQYNGNLVTAKYLDLVRDVLHLTQIRGIQLGFNSSNLKVQEESFNKLQSIFKQYSESRESAFKESVGNSLSRFLKEETKEFKGLHKLAKALLFKHSLGINFQKSELDRLTISKMMNYISSLEQYCSKLSFIFTSAIDVSGESALKQLLENDLCTYSQDTKDWIKSFKDKIKHIESIQKRILNNIATLSKSFKDIFNTDRELFNDLDLLQKEFFNYQQPPQIYEECKAVQNELRKIKDRLLNQINSRISYLEPESRSLNNNYTFNVIKDEVWLWLRGGITILIITYILSSIFVSCTSSLNSSSNYTANKKRPAWYETGYPKKQCGHDSSSNDCWYPVFITYTDSNWKQIVRNCRDVPKFQTQSAAKQRKQIQIASFNNKADAKGFAKFMDTYYNGTTWIGQRKCY